MIDIGKILKRAWHILWNYRILWIFGILLALTHAGGSGGNSSSGSGGNSNYNFNGSNGNPGIDWNSSPFLRGLYNWFQAEYPAAGAVSRPAHRHVHLDRRWPVALHPGRRRGPCIDPLSH